MPIPRGEIGPLSLPECHPISPGVSPVPRWSHSVALVEYLSDQPGLGEKVPKYLNLNLVLEAPLTVWHQRELL